MQAKRIVPEPFSKNIAVLFGRTAPGQKAPFDIRYAKTVARERVAPFSERYGNIIMLLLSSSYTARERGKF